MWLCASAASELAQNEEVLEELVKRGSGQHRESIYYGDTIQLLHLNSDLFLALHKTPAPQNPSRRRVSLKPGSNAAHFRVLPWSRVSFFFRSANRSLRVKKKLPFFLFKQRPMGSPVLEDDQIELQSVKYDPIFLGASGTFNPSRVNHQPTNSCEDHPEFSLRIPSMLRREVTGEVNGAAEVRAFTVKLYSKNFQNESFVTGLDLFRLFHVEEKGFYSRC